MSPLYSFARVNLVQVRHANSDSFSNLNAIFSTTLRKYSDQCVLLGVWHKTLATFQLKASGDTKQSL